MLFFDNRPHFFVDKKYRIHYDKIRLVCVHVGLLNYAGKRTAPIRVRGSCGSADGAALCMPDTITHRERVTEKNEI